MAQAILVIDDDEGVRESLKDFLELQGYAVRMAEDGVQGVQFAIERPPNLIILDLEMPASHGDTVFRRLRMNEKTFNIPILFLTGLSDAEVHLKLPTLPPDSALIKKPASLEKLLHHIRKFLA